MTLLVLGDLNNAQRWLAYSYEVERAHPGSLRTDRRSLLDRGWFEVGQRLRAPAAPPLLTRPGTAVAASQPPPLPRAAPAARARAPNQLRPGAAACTELQAAALAPFRHRHVRRRGARVQPLDALWEGDEQQRHAEADVVVGEVVDEEGVALPALKRMKSVTGPNAMRSTTLPSAPARISTHDARTMPPALRQPRHAAHITASVMSSGTTSSSGSRRRAGRSASAPSATPRLCTRIKSSTGGASGTTW